MGLKNKEKSTEIDLVITWVNGNDSAWLKEREKYRPQDTVIDEARYRDWGLLRYWFRCVEKHLPWIRKVFFVTVGHVPEWLNPDNPKLVIVKHEEFIPEEYLPTFNSHTIELNLHRIKGLSERFIYLNDDVFIIKPVSPDFFFLHGLPRDTFALRILRFSSEMHSFCYASCIQVINDNFDTRQAFRKNWRKYFSISNGLKRVIKTILLFSICRTYIPGIINSHLSFVFLKSTYQEVWEKAYDEMDRTCKDKFRKSTNVGPFLLKDWQMMQGLFIPKGLKNGFSFHLREGMIETAAKAIEGQGNELICINDTNQVLDVDSATKRIQTAFQTIVPEKSSYER